ncbi:MAG TPA: ABC transporter ATP-binding protein [Gaiellaceae bacterium]|nr:ABC transporter ATP-binding protein [Gaiellaceae bacterium]
MIEVAGVSKRFGSTVAVQDLSFRVEPGHVTGFLGPNGAGKSTTLRILLGLVRPDAGTATVLGASYRDLPHPAGRVGAVLEASSFHPGRRGRDHLRVVARESRIPESRVDEVLETVELTGDARRRVGGYSLGMKQRLALAGALLGDPEVVILDEPANGLDPRGMRWLRDLLRGLASEGRAVLISSHVLAEVAQTADEVVIIDRGRFVAHSTVEEVVAGGAGGVRVRTPDAARLRELLAAAGMEAAAGRDGALVVRGAEPARVGELAAQHGVVLHELVAESGSLEDVFLQLTGDTA